MKSTAILLLGAILCLVGCDESIQESDQSEPHHSLENDTTIYRKKVDALIRQFQNPAPSYVMVGSHRGSWRKAPENTLAAIDSAIADGADFVEIDVRRTGDGKLVVIHDATLDRTTNGSGPVGEKSLKSIQNLRVKDINGELTEHHVPTLAEVMNHVKGRALIMVDKGNGYFDLVEKGLASSKSIDHAIFLEPYAYGEGIKEMGKQLLEKGQYIFRIQDYSQVTQQNIQKFQDLEAAEGFELRFSVDTSDVFNAVEPLKSRNQNIWVTVIGTKYCGGHDDEVSLKNPENGWGWCLKNAGATILLTDYPAELVNYLESIGKRELK